MKKTIIMSIALIVALMAMGAIAMVISGIGESERKIAVIYQNGTEIERIDLNSVDEPYEILIESKNGGKNRIKVEHGGISMISATCPDKVCIHTGVIRNGVLPIICAPNQLVIKMETKENQTLDHISY